MQVIDNNNINHKYINLQYPFTSFQNLKLLNDSFLLIVIIY